MGLLTISSRMSVGELHPGLSRDSRLPNPNNHNHCACLHPTSFYSSQQQRTRSLSLYSDRIDLGESGYGRVGGTHVGTSPAGTSSPSPHDEYTKDYTYPWRCSMSTYPKQDRIGPCFLVDDFVKIPRGAVSPYVYVLGVG